jgi:hypothetical protein
VLGGQQEAKNRSGYRYHRRCNHCFSWRLVCFGESQPNPSMTEKMTLKQEDISSYGFRSNLESRSPMHYANEISSCLAVLSNETIALYIWIDVFNSSNASRAAFLGIIQYLVGDRENITLGHEAIYWPQGNRTEVIFIRSNIMAWVQTLSFDVYYPWQRDATIALAALQLEKMDRYLAG